MSEYMFGVGYSRPSRPDAKRIVKIARKNGCSFIETILPGTGYQHWFTGPNLGFPFDREMSNAVYADLDKAGLLGEDGKLKSKQVST